MDIKKLLDTLRMETDDIFWYLIEQLEGLGMNVDYAFDDWIYVNNNSPIMLVAHIDTIERNEKLKFRVKKNRIKARNSVLGADDRAGIYAIMDILEMCKKSNTPMPSILFTNYEECGLLGAEAFVKAKKLENKDINIFIELDRKGEDEYVYYFHGMPKPVAEWVESFGFVQDWGSMSDVMTLTEEYDIPHVNLSVGYYNQHTVNEVLYPSQLQKTIDRVFEMILNPLETYYEVDGKASSLYDNYNSYGYGYQNCNRGYQDDYGYSRTDYSKRQSSYKDMQVVPKTFNYDIMTDVLTEFEYENEPLNGKWWDEMEEANVEAQIADSIAREKGMHEMTDDEFYNYHYIY